MWCAFFFVLDWLKSSFEFSHSIFWKNLKEHFGQPNILFKEYFPTLVIRKILSCIWFLKVNSFFFVFGCAGSSWARALSRCDEQGLRFLMVLGVLTVVVSLVAEHKF